MLECERGAVSVGQVSERQANRRGKKTELDTTEIGSIPVGLGEQPGQSYAPGLSTSKDVKDINTVWHYSNE